MNQNIVRLTASDLKSIISEAIRLRLNEIASAKIYHFTSISNALRIADENTLYLQSAIAGMANTSYSHNKLFYLSTTRTKYQSFGYSRKFSDNSARIEFDGNKLNQILKAKPYSYWGYSMGKPIYTKNDDEGLSVRKQEHTTDEAEDRLYSDKASIQGIYDYIKRIDIILTDLSEENYNAYINTRNLLYSKFNRKIFVYDNLKDFNAQTDNIINNKVLENIDDWGKASYNSPKDIYPNISQIQIVLAGILSGETNNPKADSAQLLKQYGLESYIKKWGLFKRENEYFNYKNFAQLADNLSYELENLSRKPSNDKSKLLQMISDYFKKNKIRTYKDFINYKEMKTASYNQYGIVTHLVQKGLIDDKKEINCFLIRNTDTYDYVIAANPNSIKVSDINKDIQYVANNFVSYTEENMKSKDYDSYEKYINRIFSKNPTIENVMTMLKQLGYGNEMKEMLENILSTRVIQMNLNCYSLSSEMVMPQCIFKDKDKNLSFYLELFKK